MGEDDLVEVDVGGEKVTVPRSLAKGFETKEKGAEGSRKLVYAMLLLLAALITFVVIWQVLTGFLSVSPHTEPIEPDGPHMNPLVLLVVWLR